ncbi:MAG: methyltransferase domain-containing protein [Colwellia sp.]|nr:methyltransferase domain-containing protein [Colwellia sp.]
MLTTTVNYEQGHELNSLWLLTQASVKTQCLVLSLELGLFDALKSATLCETLASTLNLNKGKLALILDALWSLGLLIKHLPTTDNINNAPKYQLNSLSERYFCTESNTYCGDSFRFRSQSLQHFANGMLVLVQPIEANELNQNNIDKPLTNSGEQSWAKAASVQLLQEQHAQVKQTAEKIVLALPEFTQARTLLDLGSGPGIVAKHLASLNPLLSVTLFDLPASIEVAKKQFSSAERQRTYFLSGDFFADDIGCGYDIIWCSSVLYFAAEQLGLLAKLYKALNPGGVLISLHVELSENAQTLQQSYFYYLPLLMRGLKVPKQGEINTLLKQAGFVAIEQQQIMSMMMTPMLCHIARKSKSNV